MINVKLKKKVVYKDDVIYLYESGKNNSNAQFERFTNHKKEICCA